MMQENGDYFRKKDLSWYEDYFYPEPEPNIEPTPTIMVVDKDMDFEIEPEPNVIEPAPTVNIEPASSVPLPFDEPIILNCEDITAPPKVDAGQIFINQVSQPTDYTNILRKNTPIEQRANIPIVEPSTDLKLNQQAKTQLDFNEAKIGELSEERNRAITDEQKSSIDLKIANLNIENDTLNRLIDNLATRTSSETIADSVAVIAPKTNNNSTIAYAGLGLVAICIGILIFKK